MKALITGSTGFVGREITKEMLRRNISLRVTSRDKEKSNPEIEDVFYVDDLFNIEEKFLYELCEEIDLIIHCAWYVEHGLYKHSIKNLDSLAGTIKLAKIAIKSKVPRFIGLGTCFEYDLNQNMPLLSNSILSSDNLYGICKSSTFLTLSKAFNETDSSFAWARLFYLYGEGEDKRRFVAYLEERLSKNKKAYLGSCNQNLDFINVVDAARMICDLALDTNNGAVNICSGVPTSLKDLAFKIAKKYSNEHLLVFGANQDNQTLPLNIWGIPYQK